MSTEPINVEGLKSFELFPVQLLYYVWPESKALNESLAAIILAKEKSSPGISTSNAGGWHSEKNLHTWREAEIQTLLERVKALTWEMVERATGLKRCEVFTEWDIQAWANVNRHGHYNKHHNHMRNFNLWSGVYYVDTGYSSGNPSESGRIVFADQNRPEVQERPDLRERFSLQPTAGLMILFPSSLGHRVEEYTGTGRRITVAFNVRNERFTTIAYEIEKKKMKKQKEE